MKQPAFDPAGDQVIKTGHKVFDAQTNCIARGNIVAKTMLGWSVRCFSDVGNDLLGPRRGQYEPGELFKFDLQRFERMPRLIRAAIVKLAQERQSSLIVYEFFHLNGRQRVVHGYIATERDPSFKRLGLWVTGPTYKSNGVIYECAKYISEVT